MLAILCSASPREEYSWVRRHGSCATAKNKWHQYVNRRHAPPHTSTLGRTSPEGKHGEAVPSNLDSRRKHCFRPAWCSCCVTRILADPCSSFGTAPARKPQPNQGLPKMASNKPCARGNHMRSWRDPGSPSLKGCQASATLTFEAADLPCPWLWAGLWLIAPST